MSRTKWYILGSVSGLNDMVCIERKILDHKKRTCTQERKFVLVDELGKYGLAKLVEAS